MPRLDDDAESWRDRVSMRHAVCLAEQELEYERMRLDYAGPGRVRLEVPVSLERVR